MFLGKRSKARSRFGYLVFVFVLAGLTLWACAGPSAPATTVPKKGDPGSPVAKAIEPTATPPKVEKIRVGYSSTDMTPVPLWVAKEQGFLLKNGIDAELVFVEGGTKVVQTMIAGEIPIATVGGAGVIEGITSGANLVIIASMGSGFPYKLITSPNIKKPEDLKGKKLGVSRFGSSSDFSLRQALKLVKLDPEKDVQILQIGGDTNRTAALQSGSIDGTVLNPPGTTIVKKAGFNELLDMATLDLEYQHTTISATKAFVKNNREIVQRFMKAIVEGIHFERTNKEETKKIIAKYTKLEDPDGLEEAYMQYNGPNSKLLSAAPYPTRKGIQLVLDEVMQGKKDAKPVAIDDIVDDSFVKELEASGFIKSLYEKR